MNSIGEYSAFLYYSKKVPSSHEHIYEFDMLESDGNFFRLGEHMCYNTMY